MRDIQGQAIFDQADISGMVSAYQAALELTGLQDQTSLVKELIAKKIIEVTRAGERDPPKICARVPRELGLPLKG